MNYDRIILELLSRVQNLEEQMVEVKVQIASLNDNLPDDSLEDDQGDFTRARARDRAMKIIQEKFPDYLVEIATRREGSGIKIIKPDPDPKHNNITLIKFFHSKTYEQRTGNIEHAWHTVNLNDIIGTMYSYCLFSVVDSKGDWSFFLYSPDELGMYRDENRSSKGELLHLYFTTKGDRAFEIRDKNTEVTDHMNNWDVLS